MNQPHFERSRIHRIRLHVLPTDRFKTFAVSAYIGCPLAEETVTRTAVTPFVLRRGTQKLPQTKQFREKLDDLYGAGFGFDIYKRGDHQIVQFRLDMIDDRYVSSGESHLEQALHFLGEAITDPYLENGAFSPKYVEAEKQTVRKKLEAVINDKIRYAAERCMEEMCRNEPYRLYPLGRIEDLDHLRAEELYAHYRKWLSESPIDLYVVGKTSLKEVEAIVSQAFRLQEGNDDPGYRFEHPQVKVEQVRTVVEKLDVGQGKLNMGLRTNITYADEQYPAALMYNGILGSYPHSKLFTNVREKESLAYYASSRLDGHKGILTIQSGIEMANYEKAVAIIRKQLEAMKAGDISELELSQTVAMITNQLREIGDSAFEMISFDFNSVLSGKERTTSGLIEAVERTDRAAVSKVAEQVQLDTIYFLRDQKGE